MRKSSEIWLTIAIIAGCVMLAYEGALIAHCLIEVIQKVNGGINRFVEAGIYLMAMGFPVYLIVQILKITLALSQAGRK